MPRISVIIPAYNSERFLGQAIESVLSQTRKPDEILVVDDGSSDTSAAIAEAFPEVCCLREPHRGVAAARNRALEIAGGELIAFLDSDDLWEPPKTERQLEMLESRPEIGICFTRQQYFLEPGLPMPSWIKPQNFEGDQTAYVPSAMLVRREVFERVGLFNPDFEVGSDSDWFLRARDAGIQSCWVPEVLMRRRIHDHNVSARTPRNSPQLLMALRNSIARQRAAG